ncbi:MAG: hypothetical protein K5647_00450 [Clostridiales bacterium]|nr:hypothetical protein [Clostridiales bacterium]
MGDVKHSPEMKKQKAKYFLRGKKTASTAALELGIYKSTIGRWVRKYHEAHQMPSYEVERKKK